MIVNGRSKATKKLQKAGYSSTPTTNKDFFYNFTDPPSTKSTARKPSSLGSGKLPPTKLKLPTNSKIPVPHKKGSGIQTYLTSSHSSDIAQLKMDYRLSAMIIEGGRAFLLIEDHNLRLAIKLAKAIPPSYVPPSCHKLVDDYLPMMYNQRMATNMGQLQQHKEIFGLGLYCDVATIKKMPLYNFLAC
jgi:hypothetical protein